MKILFLYAYREVGAFAQPDIALLRERHEVDARVCVSVREMLATAVAALSADVVYCWFGSVRYLPAVVVARLARKPVLIVAGGYDVASEPSVEYGNMLGGWRRILGRLLFQMGTRVLPFSNAAAVEAERNAGVGSDRQSVVYLGVADRAGRVAPSGEKDRLVVCVGHLNVSSIRRKGVLTVVRAARLLPDVRFAIAGRMDDDGRALLTRELGPNVTLLGAVSDEERDDLFRRAAVYCQPSVHEGFGYAVAEAMLFGCVPVVSARGSLPEVAGQGALFVAPDDPESLAAGITAALRDGYGGTRTPRDHILASFPPERRATELLRILEATQKR